MKKSISLFITTLVITFISTLLLSTIRCTEISGESMMPTIHEGEYAILIRCDTYLYECKYSRDDIIVFKINEKEYIKRIVAVPNDTLNYSNDTLFVVKDKSLTGVSVKNWKYRYLVKDELNSESFIMPEERYFLLGDNINRSKDSRSLGLISKYEITGKLLLKI